jgi:hypothetical protein
LCCRGTIDWNQLEYVCLTLDRNIPLMAYEEILMPK